MTVFLSSIQSQRQTLAPRARALRALGFFFEICGSPIAASALPYLFAAREGLPDVRGARILRSGRA